MRHGLTLALAAFVSLPALQFAAHAQDQQDLTKPEDKAAYAIGMSIGNNLKRAHFDVNLDELMTGIKDVLAGNKTKLDEQQAREAIMAYQQQRIHELAATNEAAGQQFLAENAKKEGVQTMTATNREGKAVEMQYKVLQEGTGESPTNGDVVEVNYRGTTIDGKEFDSSARHGNKPATFPVTGVIPGWTAALEHMKVGGKWELYIPADLAYGERGSPGGIEPGATLIFEVELVGIQEKKQASVESTHPLTSDIIKVPSAEAMKRGEKIQRLTPEEAAKMAQEEAEKKNQ